jgi:hypothetical protein
LSHVAGQLLAEVRAAIAAGQKPTTVELMFALQLHRQLLGDMISRITSAVTNVDEIMKSLA